MPLLSQDFEKLRAAILDLVREATPTGGIHERTVIEIISKDFPEPDPDLPGSQINKAIASLWLRWEVFVKDHRLFTID